MTGLAPFYRVDKNVAHAQFVLLNKRRIRATSEQIATEPLRGRTATSMLFLSALKWGPLVDKPRIIDQIQVVARPQAPRDYDLPRPPFL
jgi:hypothetical protein